MPMGPYFPLQGTSCSLFRGSPPWMMASKVFAKCTQQNASNHSGSTCKIKPKKTCIYQSISHIHTVYIHILYIYIYIIYIYISKHGAKYLCLANAPNFHSPVTESASKTPTSIASRVSMEMASRCKRVTWATKCRVNGSSSLGIL